MASPTDAPHPSPLPQYLQVAEDLFHHRLSAEDLPQTTAHLPIISRALLATLTQQAETAVLTQPASAYALIATAEAAAQYSHDLFLRGLAAWQLARAANAWVRPQLVETAVSRAQTLFTQLQEPGWLAACTWQQNALPWTRPNFIQATAALEQALTALQVAEMDDFVPHCRLSLAYAYLLSGRFAEAERETAVAQQTFQQSNDAFGLGQCRYTQASALRRQTHFQAATHSFTAAQTLFQTAGASIHVAMTTLQLGLIQWWSQQDAPAAEAHIQQAATQFVAADLPLWTAQCQFGLSQIYQQTGRLSAATSAMQAARETFAQFQLRGLWADSSLESGWLAFFHGQYQASLDYFQQAQTLYTEIGASWQQALILMHQGEVYVQMGLYQRALHYLEDAHTRWQVLAFPQRLAACETRLARVYLHLNNYPRAHFYLDQANTHYPQSGSSDVSPLVHLLRAEILFQEGKLDEAILFLHTALTTAQSQGNQVQAARAERLLGQTLCESEAFDEARTHLETAVSHFAEMGMVIDQAACLVNLGQCYAQSEDLAAARAAWQNALVLTQGIAPELEWQVYTGLAQLAVSAGEPTVALTHYHHAVAALGKMRRALWQPAIAGSFLARPQMRLAPAIHLAITQESATDALLFIEESKAQTTIHQMMTHSGPPHPALPDELAELVSEIRWLQKQVSENTATGRFGLTTTQESYQQLIEKVKQYDTAISRFERANRHTNTSLLTAHPFNLPQFQELATAHLGQDWLALDYYQSDQQLNCVVISPTHDDVWQTPLTAAIKLALKHCLLTDHNRSLSPRHLATVGRTLLPDSVRKQLTPETTLIIAPHQQLHRLPWSALRFEEHGSPLVMACIPTITSSLHNLALLWQRSQQQETIPHKPGLVVAVADFQGRHKPLTAVLRETASLQQLFGDNIHLLIDKNATRANWQQLRQEDGLARFAFLHIASHAFTDQYSGRLSGIALYDQDIWLDELRQMAPLPPLVVLSACSSLRTLLYEGDEPMGLPAACLTAGAQSVVGSLWPILDETAPQLMTDFYRFRLSGMGAAESLCRAQRTAAQQSHSGQQSPAEASWASFLCVGQP